MNNPFSPSPYVNGDSSTFAGGFTSTTIPTSTLLAAKNNIQAANASQWKGSGGGKNTRSLYRHMRSTTSHRRKRVLACGCRGRCTCMRCSRRHRHTRTCGHRRRRRRTMRGGAGYHQWEPANLSNVYSVGGSGVHAANSALANPPPVTQGAGSPQCSSSYNHYTDAANVSR